VKLRYRHTYNTVWYWPHTRCPYNYEDQQS